MKTVLAVVVVFAASALQPVGAAPQIPPDLERACRADYQRLCRGVFPGGGRILQCLRDKAAQVSDACKAAITKAEQDGTLPAR